jgi:hypothetical protein
VNISFQLPDRSAYYWFIYDFFLSTANTSEGTLTLLTQNARKGNEAKIRFMNFLACKIPPYRFYVLCETYLWLSSVSYLKVFFHASLPFLHLLIYYIPLREEEFFVCKQIEIQTQILLPFAKRTSGR